ncbi:MAG: TerC/Alx family metal homeostasis membrane protein [Gemmatimonadales bacterium]
MPAGRTPVMWLWFTATIVVLLVVDLAFVQRSTTRMRHRSAWWTAVVIAAAAAFCALLRWRGNPGDASTFATGYVVELSLSVDNLLIFVLLLDYFAVPPSLHGMVLNWGILGALVMRGVMVVAGVALLQKFEWIFYLLGALLVFTGIRTGIRRDTPVDPERNRIVRLVRRLLPMSTDFDGDRFVTRAGGRLVATPLLLVVLIVEWTDLVFATDSIPAIFAITRDPFLVYSSNAFAVVGLRALFFAAAAALARLTELRTGVALVLVLIGLKMLASGWITIPPLAALAAVAAILGTATTIALIRRR